MSRSGFTVIVATLTVALACTLAQAVTIETVPVGNPGNVGDARYPSGGVSSVGNVGYAYSIGKYEVTAGQYTEFLNAVAKTDTYWLYKSGMSRTDNGSGITQRGDGTSDNPYTYSVEPAYINRPVNNVSFWDCCRFVNWLSNGQPNGPQNSSTTEDGSYTLNGYGGSDGRTIHRNTGARWVIPSEDEWYKAAYYKGGSTNAGYWDYPTTSDTAPGQDMGDASGNNANYRTASGVYPIDSGKYITLVGEFQNSDGPYGTFDQGGNLWEWNETTFYGFYRGVRGGSFYDNDRTLHASARYVAYPSGGTTGGFRVAYIPEPASAMLLVGGVALLRRRSRK